MSRGAIRYPKDAVSAGKLGTARIRAEIRSASEQLAATSKPPLEPALQRMTENATNGLAAMRALGRLPRGQMNKTEAAYAAHLDARRAIGEVLWFRFEAIKLRLADATFYEPDFVVMVAGGEIEMHEVKGFMTDDANVKIKVAAAQFPFTFRLVRKAKGGTWSVREV